MDLLFRPVFTRVKTPVVGSAPDRQSSGASTDSKDDIEEFTAMSTRARSTPRMSSYMGFRPTTPPLPTLSPALAPEVFPNLRNPENVYYKPSGDQLAEMLKVVMMNQNNLDPIPKHYNATVLHVLEAYQDLRMQLNAKEEAIESLKESHTKDIKDFEELATQWQQKESDYKSELKKLEVLLSKTEGGLESVALARSKSVIHGAERASETIKRGIGTIKERNSARNSQDAGVDSPDFGPLQRSVRSRRSFRIRDDKDSSATAQFEPPRRLPRKRNSIDSHSRGDYSLFSEGQLFDSPEAQTAKVSAQIPSEYLGLTLTKSQLEALERQQAQEFGVHFDSSTSSDSRSLGLGLEVPPVPTTPLIGLGILEKALPEIPVSAKERAKQTTLDKYLNNRQHSYSDPNTVTPVKSIADDEMGFSFQPGADEDILVRSTERDRTQRKTVDEQLDHRPSLPNLKASGSNIPTSSTKRLSNRPSVAHIQNPRAKVSPSPKTCLHPRTQDNEGIGRMDSSSSSIVTAVRDNSGRSSANNSQAGRPRLKANTDGTNSGSSEAVSAVTAAARAYAASNKRPSTESSRKGSESGEARFYGAGSKRPSTESSRKGSEFGETRAHTPGKKRLSIASRRTGSGSGETPRRDARATDVESCILTADRRVNQHDFKNQ